MKKTCLHAFLFMEAPKTSISPTHSLPFSSHSEPSTGRYLVRYSPVVEPLQVAILAIWSDHSPTDWHEQNVKTNGRSVQDTIDSVLHTLDLVAQHPIRDESKVENGKVKSWIIVVHISNTSHGDEWQVVEEPTEDGIERRVVDLIDIRLLEVGIASLPPDKVPSYHESYYA